MAAKDKVSQLIVALMGCPSCDVIGLKGCAANFVIPTMAAAMTDRDEMSFGSTTTDRRITKKNIMMLQLCTCGCGCRANAY